MWQRSGTMAPDSPPCRVPLTALPVSTRLLYGQSRRSRRIQGGLSSRLGDDPPHCVVRLDTPEFQALLDDRGHGPVLSRGRFLQCAMRIASQRDRQSSHDGPVQCREHTLAPTHPALTPANIGSCHQVCFADPSISRPTFVASDDHVASTSPIQELHRRDAPTRPVHVDRGCQREWQEQYSGRVSTPPWHRSRLQPSRHHGRKVRGPADRSSGSDFAAPPAKSSQFGRRSFELTASLSLRKPRRRVVYYIRIRPDRERVGEFRVAAEWLKLGNAAIYTSRPSAPDPIRTQDDDTHLLIRMAKSGEQKKYGHRVAVRPDQPALTQMGETP